MHTTRRVKSFLLVSLFLSLAALALTIASWAVDWELGCPGLQHDSDFGVASWHWATLDYGCTWTLDDRSQATLDPGPGRPIELLMLLSWVAVSSMGVRTLRSIEPIVKQ